MRQITRLFGMLFLMGVIISCSNSTENKTTSDEKGITAADEVLTVDVFMEQVEGLVGEEVKISGLVNHVCRHGGQRMFIVGEKEDSKMKITTSENIAEFMVDLEGSEVVVTGIVEEERIDEAYLEEWEMELNETEDAHESGIHDGSEHENTDEEISEKEQTMERIADYRKQIEESEKGYLAFYSIKAESFEEK